MTLHEFLEHNLSRPEADRIVVRRYGLAVYVSTIDLLRDDDLRDLRHVARDPHCTVTVEGRADSRHGDRPVLAQFPE